MIKYPINEPNLSKLEEKYVLDVLESTWLSAGGKHTVEFEKIFADYLGMKHAVAVQSGTAALHVALKAFGVGHDDCVILPNASCAASISTVVQCGAKPIVLDVEKDGDAGLDEIGLMRRGLTPFIRDLKELRSVAQDVVKRVSAAVR